MSDQALGLPFTPISEGLRLAVKATPKAKANRIGGIRPGPDGAALLTVSVTVAPEKGKANAAIIKLLAKEWGLARSDLEVTGGATARNKTILIRGDRAALAAKLETWCRTEKFHENGE